MASTDVTVKGLNGVIRKMTKMGVSVQDLKTAFRKVSDNVKSEAQGRVNSRSGDLASSIRSGQAKNKAIVRAGSAKVPYAGVINYGGYNGISAQEFLTGAAADKRSESIAMIEQEIKRLISQYGLN